MAIDDPLSLRFDKSFPSKLCIFIFDRLLSLLSTTADWFYGDRVLILDLFRAREGDSGDLLLPTELRSLMRFWDFARAMFTGAGTAVFFWVKGLAADCWSAEIRKPISAFKWS